MQMDETVQRQLAIVEQAIRTTINTLPEAEQNKIEAAKRCFFELINAAGDAGKVAFVLFQMEYEMGDAPYGELFTDFSETGQTATA